MEYLPWSAQGFERHLSDRDIWCVPEGWPNAVVPGVRAGARTLLYVQNWIFMMTVLPGGVRWADLPLRYFAVSHPVAWFMKEVLGLACDAILPPAVAPVFFQKKSRSFRRIRICWMPRKNKAMAGQIRDIALARLSLLSFDVPVDFIEVHGHSLAEVAEVFASSHIFLCTGFPEGFGLPPVEAMASGCVPVGFAGLGGWEYMRNPEDCPLSGLYSPPFVLEKKAWSGNGFFVSDGDVLSAGLALAYAVELVFRQDPGWRVLEENARRTAAEYSREVRELRLASLWPAWMQ